MLELYKVMKRLMTAKKLPNTMTEEGRPYLDNIAEYTDQGDSLTTDMRTEISEEQISPSVRQDSEIADNSVQRQYDSTRRTNRFLKCITDNTSSSEAEPLLPIHSPRLDVPEPGSLKLAVMLLKFIWNSLLTQCDRNFFYKYRIIIVVSVLISALIILFLTGNLGYLHSIGQNVICYLLNAFTNQDYQCYKES